MKTTKFVYFFLVVLSFFIYSCSSENSPLVIEPTPINDTIYKDSIILHSYDYKNLSFYTPFFNYHIDSIQKKTDYFASFYDTINKINYLCFVRLKDTEYGNIDVLFDFYPYSMTYEKITKTWSTISGKTKTTFKKDSVYIYPFDSVNLPTLYYADFYESYISENILYLRNYNMETFGKIIFKYIGGENYFNAEIEMNNGFKFNTIFFNYKKLNEIFGKNPYLGTANLYYSWYSKKFLELNIINKNFSGNVNIMEYTQTNGK